MKTILRPLTVMALATFAGLLPARSESFSEPPVVIYGKVIQITAGANFQLFNGDLTLTISNETDWDHVITKTIPLSAVGEGGTYSYRVELPVKYLPGVKELADNLSVGHVATPYRLINFFVDGFPAVPLEESLSQLALDFSHRATVHRLDLIVAMESPDTDGDGMPDWWEDRYGLNRHYAPDATADSDGDQLSNVEEFRNNTDPNTADFDAVVKTTSLKVPLGGKAGLSLLIIDQDTAPADLSLVVLSEVEGLSWYRDGIPLPETEYFSYADILAGKITLETASDFAGAAVNLGLHDSMDPQVDRSLVLQVEVVSPGDLGPAVWLHGGTLDADGPITEWFDASDFHRDGYQPGSSAEPTAVAGQRVDFASGQFLYVDDRDLTLPQFTAFLAFEISAAGSSDQTLLSSPDLQLRLGGDANARSTRSLEMTQTGRILYGPAVEFGQSTLIALGTRSGNSFLVSPDQQYFISTPSPMNPLSTFTTIGGLQRFSDASARDFLEGGVQELILFNRELSVEDRSRLEAYQLARWEGWLMWEYLEETLPMQIQGVSNRHNLLKGGWGNDTLRGGSLSDHLTGGPGADLCFGGAGPDRFAIRPDSGNDVVGDFSTAEGDVLDLTGLFAGKTGSPEQYVHLRAVVTRGEDNVPRVDSLVELDYAGNGGDPDQVITLKAVSVGNSDLPRLVGEGAIRLGGPRYPTSVWLVTAETSLSEAGAPHDIKVVRSGNLEAALEVNLGFTGTAQVDEDYLVDGVEGSGVVRRVLLGRGQAEQIIQIVPVPDSRQETETIQVQVLSSAVITDRPEAPLLLTLVDGSFLTIRTLQHLQIGSSVPGQVQINRTGNLDQTLEVHLGFGGNLTMGVDYEAVPTLITMAAGEAVKVVLIHPTAPPSSSSEVEQIQVSLEPGPDSYLLGDPRQTEVLVLPEANVPSYAQWMLQAPDGQDGLLEYVTGSDSDPDAGHVEIRRDEGVIELRFVTRAGLTDVALSVVGTPDLSSWTDVTDEFSLHLNWTGDGRVSRIYRSKVMPAANQRYFRIFARALGE